MEKKERERSHIFVLRSPGIAWSIFSTSTRNLCMLLIFFLNFCISYSWLSHWSLDRHSFGASVIILNLISRVFFRVIGIILTVFLFLTHFLLGISDVTEAYLAAMKGASADSLEVLPQTPIQGKANTFTEHLRSDQSTAVDKIQDGLQYLSYLVLSTSMPSAWELGSFAMLNVF